MSSTYSPARSTVPVTVFLLVSTDLTSVPVVLALTSVPVVLLGSVFCVVPSGFTSTPDDLPSTVTAVWPLARASLIFACVSGVGGTIGLLTAFASAYFAKSSKGILCLSARLRAIFHAFARSPDSAASLTDSSRSLTIFCTGRGIDFSTPFAPIFARSSNLVISVEPALIRSVPGFPEPQPRSRSIIIPAFLTGGIGSSGSSGSIAISSIGVTFASGSNLSGSSPPSGFGSSGKLSCSAVTASPLRPSRK